MYRASASLLRVKMGLAYNLSGHSDPGYREQPWPGGYSKSMKRELFRYSSFGGVGKASS